MDEPTDTENEELWKRATISSTDSERSTNPLRAKYAALRARLLLGCYRRGEANDPDTYVAAIAAVLALFEPEIIREATDPRTGIQTTEKFMAFMPNAGEVKSFCEALAGRKDRLERYAAMPRAERPSREAVPPDPPPGPDGKHRPGTILANYETAFKIYGRPVNDLELDTSRIQPPPYNGPPFVPHTWDQLRAIYGIHPNFAEPR